jgi:hypothetical protein
MERCSFKASSELALEQLVAVVYYISFSLNWREFIHHLFPTDRRAILIAAGGTHTCALLDGTGGILCWGISDKYQIFDKYQSDWRRSQQAIVGGGFSPVELCPGQSEHSTTKSMLVLISP